MLEINVGDFDSAEIRIVRKMRNFESDSIINSPDNIPSHARDAQQSP